MSQKLDSVYHRLNDIVHSSIRQLREMQKRQMEPEYFNPDGVGCTAFAAFHAGWVRVGRADSCEGTMQGGHATGRAAAKPWMEGKWVACVSHNLGTVLFAQVLRCTACPGFPSTACSCTVVLLVIALLVIAQ